MKPSDDAMYGFDADDYPASDDRDELLARAAGAEALLKVLAIDAEALRAAESDVAKLIAASVLMHRVLAAAQITARPTLRVVR